ncbi:DUF3558 domain-containing protein [Rhodococcus sp. PvR099]|jgi:hypothetical protein|uniref:DUF3558 domain-containing protein n=1 Tax=Rhodococcus sp. PvR099 TaxID=2806602 RepID=UPI001AE88ABC|nr:DUF3558 domain-containing protein [Rhodococcus sp. PvR099]
MRVRTRGLVALGAACGALMLAGCGSETVAGEAEAVGAGAGEPAFSPCDDIPDEALQSLGMDPASESPDVAGVKQPGWKICSWNEGPQFLGVFATTRSMDEVRDNKNNEDFTQVSVGDRRGMTYREVADTDRRSCDVAVESGNGVVLIQMSNLGRDPLVEEPCAAATRAASALLSYVPE